MRASQARDLAYLASPKKKNKTFVGMLGKSDEWWQEIFRPDLSDRTLRKKLPNEGG